MSKKILIYGAGKFGYLVKNISEECGLSVEGFISDIKSGENIIGNFDFIKNNYSPDKFDILVGIGYADLENRKQICENILREKYSIPNLIHPKSYVSGKSKLGTGNIIMANSTVDYNSALNNFVVLWPGAVINHDCSIGNNTFISPGAIVCGHVTIGNGCFVGAGSIITDRTYIGDNLFIKAGLTVSLNNIPELKRIKNINPTN